MTTTPQKGGISKIIRLGFVLILLLLFALFVRQYGCGIYQRTEKFEWIE